MMRTRIAALMLWTATGVSGCASFVLYDPASPCGASCLRNGPVEQLNLADVPDYTQHYADSQQFVRTIVLKSIADSDPPVPTYDYQGKISNQQQINDWFAKKYQPAYSSITGAQIYEIGAGYVDKKCDEYFTALFRYQEYMRTAVADIGLIGTTGAGIMSALSASAKAIQVLALGANFGAGFAENMQSVLLYEINVGDTRRLVARAKRSFTESITPPMVATPLQAAEVVRRYARLCLPSEIESMVREAVRAATFKDLDGSDTRREINSEGLVAMRKSVADEIGYSGVLSEAQIAQVYWFFSINGGKIPATVDQSKYEAISADALWTVMNKVKAAQKIATINGHLNAYAAYTNVAEEATAFGLTLQKASATPASPATETTTDAQDGKETAPSAPPLPTVVGPVTK